jgi:O-antigen/teichoic acid export membrane protein
MARGGLLQLAQQMDIILLSALSAPNVVAGYKVARTIANVPTRIAAPAWVLVRRTLISSVHRGSAAELFVVLSTRSLVLIAALALVVSPLFIWAEEILVLAFGAEFAPAAPALRVLLATGLIFGAGTGWSSFLGSIMKQKNTVISIYAAQVVVIGVSALFWPKLGATEMAVIFGASQLLVAASFWLLVLRSHRTSTAKSDK